VSTTWAVSATSWPSCPAPVERCCCWESRAWERPALLAAAAWQATAAGVRVLQTVGVQYRAQASYGALQQLLTSSPEVRSRAAGTPVLAAALDLNCGSAPGHDAVTDAVVSLIADLSHDVPTLLVLDDAQWLDAASAVVLGQAARRLVGTGAGMLCAARPRDESFFDYSGIALHELGPLSDAASEQLLACHFPTLAPRVRRRLMADAEGNPLALLELPTALTDSQRCASQALPHRLPLTERLQTAFASRIEGLPTATRHLLLVAALEGSGNLQVVRRAVADRSNLKYLAPAERARLVFVDDATGRLGFRHSLMRSAVVDLSTSDQRRSVHRALADAWIDVPEQRAWHLAQAAVEPDEKIAFLLEQVAEGSARRGDGPNAVAALLRAADLSAEPSEQARRLAKAAYCGANLTGDLREVPQPAGQRAARLPERRLAGRGRGHRRVPAQQLRRPRHRAPPAVRRDRARARALRSVRRDHARGAGHAADGVRARQK